MNSKLKSIIIISFIAFAIIAGIPTVFENVIAEGEEAELRQNQSPPPPTLDDDNDDMIISEEICPPYCSPPPPVQELP
jgi:hypothetical protein